MGTDFSLHVQGISNSSSSECNIYLGNYEKSDNNVPLTALTVGLLGCEHTQPPHPRQGARCQLAAGCQHAAGSRAPGPWCAGRPPSPGRVSEAGPRGTSEGGSPHKSPL